MNWTLVGGVWGFLAVALGAFGAHGLRPEIGETALGWWKTAAQYHLAHALALVLTGLLQLRGVPVEAAGWAFLAGSLVFSGTLYALTLGAPRWLGAITPLGGLGLLAGWLLLAWAARSLPPRP
jgi:uncharacterized membrane protein YgdD (TMEM256/DUF423 family)